MNAIRKGDGTHHCSSTALDFSLHQPEIHLREVHLLQRFPTHPRIFNGWPAHTTSVGVLEDVLTWNAAVFSVKNPESRNVIIVNSVRAPGRH